MPETNPALPTDDDARSLARTLLRQATHAALGTLPPNSRHPMVTRIALITDPEGAPLTLISDLSHHTRILRQNPACSLLVGEPGPKGDPMTHPRLTIQATAKFIEKSSAEYTALRDHFLDLKPKAKLYIDFADFHLVRFTAQSAWLNGGFARAYDLTPEDILPN